MQYTIRNLPEALDAALRRRAREQDLSLNEVAIQAMARGMGFTKEQLRYRDLSDLAGSWNEDSAFDAAIAEQDFIEEELWK